MYQKSSHYAAHARHLSNEKKLCQLCEAYYDSISTKILYTKKEIFMMETSMFDFYQQLFTPTIQKLALQWPHV